MFLSLSLIMGKFILMLKRTIQFVSFELKFAILYVCKTVYGYPVNIKLLLIKFCVKPSGQKHLKLIQFVESFILQMHLHYFWFFKTKNNDT